MKKKIFKGLLVLSMMITAIIGNVNPDVHALENETVYAVSEDAYLHSGNPKKAYSYENITKAHGTQYEGKNYKVMNTKSYPDGRQLMSVMKLKLPTKEEAKQFNQYMFEFHIFKNANFNNAEQTYRFFYSTDVNWKEDAITWENRPESIKPLEENLLFDFKTLKGEEYETKPEQDKIIRIDVSEKIQQLIKEDVKAITIFTVGKDKADTSLMVHTKESGDGILGPRLIASKEGNDKEKLNALVEECKKIEAGFYSDASYEKLQSATTNAQESLKNGTDIALAYDTLLAVKKALQAEFYVLEDAFIRKDRATTKYNYENITKAHGAQYEGKNYKVLNVKNNGNQEIITLMKFKVPSKEEIEKYKLDNFTLEFNMFKNPDFNNGDQTYRFYYSEDINWEETNLTWNNKPNSVKHDGENLLCEFEVHKGDEYETKTDEEKHIRLDITEKVKELIDKGITECTIFASADKSLNTSIMFHSKESSNGTLGPKITASSIDYSEDLKALIEECEALDPNTYTEDSYKKLEAALEEAKRLGDDASLLAIHIAYDALLAAKEALVSTADPEDVNNVAYQKPARSNLDKNNASKVSDGSLDTTWSGIFYPSYVDVDLMDTYDLTKLKVYMPEGKVSYYTIYGSNDGRNYDFLYQKRSDVPASKDGDEIVFDEVKSYRILRVYIEYTKGESKTYLSELKAYGTKTKTNTGVLREGTLEEILDVKAYDETEYAKPITKEETIENVYGIIDRTVGPQYRNWFSFELVDDETGKDWYEISDKDGKVHIKGNEGLSLTTGLNYYYKNYLNVHISEQTMQIKMPKSIVQVKETIHKETPYQVRYAFNYCTLSYTFAFFGEEEWQRENDWLALNGVNVVLDLAGQEATWIKFLMNFGYSYDDAKDWLVGPGYYAWQFMDNMEVFGGPIPDGYVKDRLELARSTQRWKNSLGMQTVLQGYAGMVPTNFKEFYKKDIQIIKQGTWNGFDRPDMIATDSEQYDEFSKLFYEAQEFVYGKTTDYYAVDPFHEGGKRPQGLTDDKIAAEVLESMLAYDKGGVWIVQGWQSNPTNKLLEGMGDYREDHVLIVDLIKYPLLSSGEAQYKKNEFNGTSWAWCLLGNFGGNPTMNGEMETMVEDIMEATKNSKHMSGIGIISEATYDNPILYDLIFDLAWADNSFNLDTWMDGYVERRYGAISENAKTAWDLMKDANYNYGVRLHPELYGIRTGGVPRNIGKKSIAYDTKQLENALRLLVEDFDKFKDSEGYLYDLGEIMRQVTSNYAVMKYYDVIDAREAKDIDAFRKAKAEFLNSFDVLNAVQATQQDQLAGEWIGKALDRAKGYDDFSKSTFAMNAKSLISTWGSSGGALIDYGFRTYEGMFLDLPKSNWVEYLDQVEENIVNGKAITVLSNSRGYVNKYWQWVIDDKEYTRDAKDSPEEIKAISNRVLDECVFTGELDPNIGNIALNRDVESFGENNVGKSSVVTDGKTDKTFTAKDPKIIIDLIAEFDVSKINVVNDGAENRYAVYVSSDKKEWIKINEEAISKNNETDVFEDLKVNARYIKIQSIDEKQELKVKEVRVYGDRMLPTLEQLERLVDTAEKMDISASSQGLVNKFNDALKDAHTALEEAAPDAMNTAYWNLYDVMIQMDTSGLVNVVKNKPVKAHNDPSGNVKNLVDGNLSSKWDSGRLSPPGKPYQDEIVPGWAVIDLEGLYEISQIELIFTNNNMWHQYELYGSLDQETWFKLGEKKSETQPNKEEDTYEFEPCKVKYMKLVTTNIQKGNDGRRNGYLVAEMIVKGKKAVEINKDNLIVAITEAEKLNEKEYTPNSWEAFSKVLNDAKAVRDNDKATQVQVDEAVKTLKEAVKALIEKADDTKLKEVMSEAEARLNASDITNYSEASVNALKQAVAEAKKLDGNATQEAIDAATNTIEEAIGNLELKKADYTKVNEAIERAKALNKEDYVDFSKVEAAIKAVEKDLDITKQKEVDAMAKAITDAIEALEKKPVEIPVDKEVLSEAIDKANTLDLDLYTKESVEVLLDALEKAGKVNSDENATQEEVDEAVAVLKEAIKGLKEVTPTTPNEPDKDDSTNDNKEEGTQTGDTTNVGGLLALLGLAGAAIAYTTRKRRIK